MASRDGGIRLFFEDGEHDFRLGIGELKTLQEKRDAGPLLILTRLRTGAWFVEDIYESVRLGLVGGGMDKEAAYRKVEQNVRSGNLLVCLAIATAVVFAALADVEDDAPGEVPAEAEPTPPTPASESDGQASTASAAPRASRRKK